MSNEHDTSPLSHVVDHDTYEIPLVEVEVHLPNVLGVQISRFMVMEVVAAILMAAILIPLARHIAHQRVTRGRFWNIFEAIVVFIRDGIARPAIDGGEGHGHLAEDAHDLDHELAMVAGAHDAEFEPPVPPHDGGHTKVKSTDRASELFLPFLWTMFFFILFCNLLGMIPGGASPTGNISVTATLAFLTFCAVVAAGVRALGPIGFLTNLVPHMDVPKAIKPILWGLMFVIELAGLLIKHVVLSVRLFANMLAGHIVLAVILGFVTMAAGLVTWIVTPASIAGALGIGILELFVAFLQAYIFTFLAALFIGTAVHPH